MAFETKCLNNTPKVNKPQKQNASKAKCFKNTRQQKQKSLNKMPRENALKTNGI